MSKPIKKHSNAQVSPIVDAILTGAFFLLTLYCCYAFFASTPNHEDLYIFFAFCFLVFIAIKATETFCAIVVRDFLSPRFLNSGTEPDPLSKKASFVKFIATAWQLVIHFSMTLFELWILWDEAWLSHPYTTFIPAHYFPKDSLRYFYILQIAIWIMTCVSHRFNSDAHAHKDYVLMYVHHLATIALVAISFHNGQSRIGLVVLFLHDCSDIAIDILKLSNYLVLDGPSSLFITEIAYAWTMISWIYFRLWYFPYYVIWKGTIWAMAFGGQGNSINGDIPAILTIPPGPEYDQTWWVGFTCSVLLILLFLMHVWWFFLLFKILLRMLKKDNMRQISHDEYEGDGVDASVATKKDAAAVNAKAKKID